jgi:hypothetical protein
MAYYTSGQWPAVQTSSWSDPPLQNDWQNSAITGGSPESSSVSRSQGYTSEQNRSNVEKSSMIGSPSQGYYEPMDMANTTSYSASSYSQGAASNSAYYSHHSEAPSTSYLPTTGDDVPYYYSGDTTSYDPSQLSPSAYSADPAYQYQDNDANYDLPPETDSSGRRKSSASSSKQKRQLQNRLAQRAFRERQAKQQEELHRKVRHLKEQYEDLEGKYEQLRGEHERCGRAEHRRDCNCGRS